MKNEELIKALRWCGSDDDDNEYCVDANYSCPYFKWDKQKDYCKQEMMRDAADALEAAEKRIAELEEEHNKTVTAIFQEEQLWWVNRCKELEAERMELTAKYRRLEARIPELEKDIIYWQTYAAEIER